MKMRGIKYNLIRLFRLKKGAHQVALGIAVGFIPGWFPTFGFGAIFSVILARLVGASIVSALISGASVTFLWPFLYFFNYKVGNMMISSSSDKKEITKIEDVNYVDSYNQVTSWQGIGIEFLIGAIVNTIIFGLVMYGISYWLFKKYRQRILKNLRDKSQNNSDISK